MNKKIKIRLIEISLLTALVVVYGWFFWHYFSMLPDSNDPLEYIEPSRWKTLVGYYPWVDRLVIADGVRFLSFFIHRLEIAGAVYFGIVNFLILIIAVVWAYLKKGFWSAFIIGLLLTISYPLVRYANYGYPDASVALFGLVAFIFYASEQSKKFVFWTGFFAILAVFSKITGLAILAFFIFDLLKNKKYYELKLFAYGVISSGVFVLLATDLFFGFNSLKYVFNQIGTNISANIEPRSVGQSFFNVLRPEVFLPAYLAIFLFLKGIKDELSKRLFSLASFFIIFLVMLVIFSSHVKIYAHYLYTAQIFATIALGFHLANIKSKTNKNQLYPPLFLICGILILVFIGLRGGIFYINYVGTGKFLTSPWWFKGIYVFFAVGVTGLLLLIKFKKSQKLVFALLIILAILGSFFVTASAYSVIKKQKQEIAYFYNYSLAFKEASQDFSVYDPSQDQIRYKRIVWVYFLFYSNTDATLLQEQRPKMAGTVNFIKKEDISSQKGLLITEGAAIVLELDPNAKIIKTYEAGDGDITVFEL